MRRSIIFVAVLASVWSAGASAAPDPAPSRSRIEIPRLHLAATVTMSVDAGPAWWPGVARPGGGTTVAIAGHRTTHTRPFRHLDELVRGDLIVVTSAGRRFKYRVSGRRVFPASDLHIADRRPHEVLILSTCTPPGSDAYRMVVYALPVS